MYNMLHIPLSDGVANIDRNIFSFSNHSRVTNGVTNSWICWLIDSL